MTDQTPNSWRGTVRSRAVVVAVLFASWTIAIEARLVYLQVFRQHDLQMRADDQQTRTVPLPAQRGEILDRYGNVLARSVEANAIFVVPTAVKNPVTTANALCAAIHDCTPAERDRFLATLQRKSHFGYIRRANRLTDDDVKRVEELKLPGVGLMRESRRYYPNNELAAHVLGFVNTDSEGLGGVEGVFNKDVRGREGTVFVQVDGSGKPFSSIEKPFAPGTTLQLTVDRYLQFVAETELKAGVEEFGAKGGSVVMMDPNTGDIIAMANYPSYNPNSYSASDKESWKNRGVQNTYEPGSTFKIVTASAALEEHVMSPSDPIDVSGGAIRIGSRTVHDTHRYGVLTFTDVLVKSSNVGAIKIGMRLGADRLGRYVARYGFGTRLAPDFKGAESAGLMWNPKDWTDSALASVSMGYQIGVTPLQMATAASTVANGGQLFRPRIVKARIRADGRVDEVPPQVMRRVIEPATAEQLTTIMENVVERGTATAAKIPGYSIAGKTGTAAKLEEAPNGKKYYSKSDYNASFVGFIPSRRPALTILVVLDSPHGKGYYGGTVSAPIFKRIAQKAMQRLGIPPNVTPEAPLLASRRDAKTPVHASAPFKMPTAIVPLVTGQTNGVPDLIGLSAREAIRVLARVGVTPRVSGDGVVVQQEPAAGTPLEPGMTCSLALGRLAAPVLPPSDQRQ